VSDVARLLAAFDGGGLVRPSAEVPNTVDLARAVAAVCGVEALTLTPNALAITEVIGQHDHVILVLVDGLGMNLVEREKPESFLRRHLRMELQSVFPSSTAPALTSIATGTWPSEHAVPGWYTHLPTAGITATILPFVERYAKKDARKLGVTPGDAFPVPAIAAGITRKQLRVMPKRIDGSVYSNYSSGGSASVGYRSLGAAVDAVCDFILTSNSPTYTYLYTSFVDTAEHERGLDSKSVRRAMKLVQSRLEVLAERLAGGARIIITADHGQIEVAPERQLLITDDDPLLDMLVVPPTCEPRVPAFHVREGQHAAFEQAFRDRFGAHFALLTIAEVDQLRLFGRDALSFETRRRLGDYVGVALGPFALMHRPEHPMIGFHGGAQRDEMRIPLIIV
jgi:hypothetical protein